MRSDMATACGLMPPTMLFRVMPPKTGVLIFASRSLIASRSMTVLWWWDFTSTPRIPSRSPSLPASAWSMRRGNGFGPEWQCRSTQPFSSLMMAGESVMKSPGVGSVRITD